MAGFDVSRIAQAFAQGQQIKHQRERLELEKQDRDLDLKERKEKLRLEELAAKRAEVLQNMQLNPHPQAPEIQTSAPQTTTMPFPGQAGEPQTSQFPDRSTALPLPPTTVPGVFGPDTQVPRTSMQQFLQQQEMAKQQGLQDERAKMQMQREANTFTVKDPASGQDITAPKEIIDNLLTQSGQNKRQSEQQAFTAEQNEAKAKADAEQSKLDRASRENIATANRIQRAAAASQSGKQSKTTTQAMTLGNRFDSNPIVRQYATLKEALDFATSLPADSKNPADDIGLIYAFAKAMDPGSVVREGEYATVQKYAQSWADKFGFDVKRLYSNTPFLSPEVKASLKSTIQAKVKASEGTYNNLRKETEKKFKNIGEDPSGWITDYGTASGGPAVGTVEGGYVFQGGDPADQKNWKKQ